MSNTETTAERRAKLKQIRGSSGISSQVIEESRRARALETIKTIRKTGTCREVSIIQFYGSHLPDFPSSISEFRELPYQRQVFLIDPIQRLNEAFGEHYPAVYWVWNRERQKDNPPTT